MKANELMIGDCVLTLDSTHEKKVFAQVDAIEEGKNTILVTKECSNWFVDIDWIEPIPLTPDILEKNGFHKEWDEDIEFMVYDTIRVEIGSNYKLYKDGKMYLHRVLAPLYYVHQLQHALRLCGISKEIEL